MRGKVIYRDNKGRVHSSGNPQGCVVCGERKNEMIWHNFDGPWCLEHYPSRSSEPKGVNE